MIVKGMENKLLEQLAKDIAQSRNKHKIINEIEWLLDNHYEKNRFLALLMVNNLYKPEYYELSDKLSNKDLLLKLYELTRKNMNK